MKAVCWMGTRNIQTLTVPDPKIVNPHDVILKITRTAICGSDLHLYDGYIPTMVSGDVLGHEFMGIVEEVGPEVKNLQRGDRVIVPFTISCGNCFFCKRDLWSLCDNTNPNAQVCGDDVRLHRVRAVRLLAYLRRLCRWTSAVCARAACRCRAA